MDVYVDTYTAVRVWIGEMISDYITTWTGWLVNTPWHIAMRLHTSKAGDVCQTCVSFV